MNRNISIFVVCTILLFWVSPAFGCLSNTINIGILNTDKSRLLAELVLQTINERTGTNVRLLVYKNEKELNGALTITNRDDRIDLLIEDLEKFKQIAESKKITLSTSTENTASHDKDDLLSFIQTPLVIDRLDEGGPEIMIFYRSDLLNDFPLLPRLLNKLSRKLDFKNYIQVLQYVADGRKPKNVAKDFLRKKNLI